MSGFLRSPLLPDRQATVLFRNKQLFYFVHCSCDFPSFVIFVYSTVKEKLCGCGTLKEEEAAESVETVETTERILTEEELAGTYWLYIMCETKGA